ncbi:hypothetical protein Tco_0552366, partial [Tanacetum coccineum]
LMTEELEAVTSLKHQSHVFSFYFDMNLVEEEEGRYLYGVLYMFIDRLVDLVKQIPKIQSENPISKIPSRVIKSVALLPKNKEFLFK